MSPSKPLVVVTRDEGHGGPLASALAAQGAEVFYLTTITFAAPADSAALDMALASPHGYDWVVFTSARAVESVCSRPAWAKAWETRVRPESVPSPPPDDPDDAASSVTSRPGAPKRSQGSPGRWQIAAAGSTTANRLAAFGVASDIVPERAGAAALAAALLRTSSPIAHPLAGARILWPRSEIADRSLAATLTSAGADVIEVVAYRTVPGSEEPLVRASAMSTPPPRPAARGEGPSEQISRDRGEAREFLRLLDAGRIAAVTFLSPSSAKGLAAAAGSPDLAFLAGRTAIASIGPTTSAALGALGAPADVESPERTAGGLARALMGWLDGRREVAR